MELNESNKTVVLEHPLPKEIQEMNRNDTVCKYCGVSYLIHNEIKALEDKLRKTEEKLKHFEGGEDRELTLKDRIKKLDADKLLTDLSMECKDATIQKLTVDNDSKDGEIEIYKRKVSESESLMKSLQFRHKTFSEGLRHAHSLVMEQRKLAKDCRSLVASEKLLVAEKLKSMAENLKLSSQFIIRDSVITKDRLAALEYANCHLITTETQQSTTIKKLRFDIQQREQVDEQLTHLQHEKTELDRRFKELSNRCSTLLQQNEIMQSGADRYKDIISIRDKDLSELRTALQNSTKLSEGAVIKLRREINVHISEIDQMKGELGALRRERDEAVAGTKRAKDCENLQERENNDINETLKRARMDLEAANQERQMTIASHQQQIYDLRESFKRRTQDSDGWELRLKSALEEERVRSAIEFRDLEARLVESAAIETRIAVDKYAALSSQQDERIRLAEETVRRELSNLHSRDMKNAGQKLDSQRLRHDEASEVTRAQLSALKAVIGSLEQKLASIDLDGGENLNRKEIELREFREKYTRLEVEKNTLEMNQNSLLQEITFLQETVRRECEERLETTEILKALKAELLLNRKSPSIKSPNQLPQRRSSTNDSKSHLTSTRNSSPREKEEMIIYRKTQNKAELTQGNTTQINLGRNTNKGSINDSRQRIAEAVARKPSPDF